MIPGIKKRAVNFYDLMMYVAIARKHFRLMVLLVCFTSVAGLTYYVYAKSVYHARSLIRLETISRPLDEETVSRGTPADVTIQELNSAPVIQRTAAHFGFHGSAQAIMRDHIKKISIIQTPDHHLQVDVWAYNYNVAVKWAEYMVQEFLSYREEQRINYREAVVKSYTREMAQVSNKLDESLGKEFDFEDQKATTQNLIQLNQLSEVPVELVSVKQRLADLERVRASLDNPDSKLSVVEKLSMISGALKSQKDSVELGQAVPDLSGKALGEPEAKPTASTNVIVVPSMVDNQDHWEDLDRERRRIEDEIREASRIYLPGHRKMIALRKQLDDVQKNLALEYGGARSRFDVAYNTLLQKQSDLESKLPEYQDVNKRHERLEQQTMMYQAGQLAWKDMYANMAKELSALDFAQEKERVTPHYEGLIEAKSLPESPNRMHVFMLSVGLGFILAIAIPFGIEYLDHTISNFEEVEATFQMRGLGMIPILQGEDAERAALLDPADHHEQTLQENFRVIRTNLISMGTLTKAPHVIMVTSSLPKEGKTVVSSNLAVSFSQMGARTLLIDADLRRGRIHRLFGLRKTPGLSSILLDKIPLEDALRPTGKECLHVMTAGDHLNTGTELLSSKRFADLLTELRGRYDRIIIDTPPVLGLSETSAIQQLVDGVVFVAWCGRTPIKTMQVSIEMLANNGANFYGFVLNRLDLNNASNYYQYYYYSNDYYRNYHALENA